MLEAMLEGVYWLNADGLATLMSNKTAIHFEVIAEGFEQPINEIDTSFLMPNM